MSLASEKIRPLYDESVTFNPFYLIFDLFVNKDLIGATCLRWRQANTCWTLSTDLCWHILFVARLGQKFNSYSVPIGCLRLVGGYCWSVRKILMTLMQPKLFYFVAVPASTRSDHPASITWWTPQVSDQHFFARMVVGSGPASLLLRTKILLSWFLIS